MVIALPEDADRQIMNYFIGDDSPDSYLEASVFLREIDAGWHARIGWPIEYIIAYNGTPSVIMNETHVVVRMTTEQEYCGSKSIQQYADMYTRPNLTPVSQFIFISEEEGGGICY